MPSEATIERYRNAAVALLPPGRALSRRLDSDIAKILESISVEHARIHEEADTFLRNLYPLGANEYIDEWEEALGLPGDCVTNPPTELADRQGAILAKIRGRTSHAQSVFEDAAEDLGYTDLEFVHFAPFEAGSSAVGAPVYSDEWMHVVRVYVPVSNQTAATDETLVCTFEDLRRAHSYFDVILEGPMGAERTATTYYNDSSSSSLAASGVLANLQAVSIRYGGLVAIQTIIDNGAGGAHSDTPVGTFELWASTDGVNYTQVTTAATELDKIKPNGNNVVGAFAIFDGVPGTSIKVRYNRTSGGTGNSRLKMYVAAW